MSSAGLGNLVRICCGGGAKRQAAKQRVEIETVHVESTITKLHVRNEVTTYSKTQGPGGIGQPALHSRPWPFFWHTGKQRKRKKSLLPTQFITFRFAPPTALPHQSARPIAVASPKWGSSRCDHPPSLRLAMAEQGVAMDQFSASVPSPFVVFKKKTHDSHPSFDHLILLVFEAVMEVVCVSLPGYIIARLGHFDADKQKFLANLNVMLFTPCLSKYMFPILPDQDLERTGH